MPLYDRRVDVEPALAFACSTGAGFEMVPILAPNMALVDYARNWIVTRFLLETDCTDLLFWDINDTTPPIDGISRIAAQTRPVVGGIYPDKTEDGSENYPVDFTTSRLEVDAEGLMDVPYLPTGFMRINRAVFDHLPYVKYRSRTGVPQLGFFSCELIGQVHVGPGDFRGDPDGSYVPEDAGFCHRWRGLGGSIYAIPDMSFRHWGQRTWQGNLLSWLRTGVMGKLHEAERAA